MLWLVSFFAVFIIILLIITVVVSRKSKRQRSEVTSHVSVNTSLESLVDTLKTEKDDVSKVNAALEQMLYGFPFPEDEKRVGEYLKFVYFYAKNPLTNAKMIVQMQKRLTKANPKYAKQIEDFQMRGVDARTK